VSDKNVTKYFVTLVWMKHTPEGSVASGSTRAFVDTSTRLEALEQAKKFAADLRYKDKRMPPDATIIGHSIVCEEDFADPETSLGPTGRNR